VQSTATTPLVVDLDGTLTPTDTLVESVVHLVKIAPLSAMRIPFWLLKGRAEFKEAVAHHSKFSTRNLPFREPLVEYLHEEKAKGRRIVLATAAHRLIADRVAEQLGLFDEVLATNEGVNLKGKNKLDLIQDRFGQDFVYAGDSPADIPIWNASKAAVLVGVSNDVASRVRKSVPIEKEFARESVGLGIWLQALRPHQWIKNLLLLVPLLTAFRIFDLVAWMQFLPAFSAFSLAASATYMVNDLWDLENDRRHPRKKFRPFASGRLPILQGIAVAAFLLAVALALAISISLPFFLVLVTYLALTSAYSWVLKQYALVDVVTLSVLYTLRIIAGSVDIGIVVSTWLLAFSVFIFLSLALVKRCAELVAIAQSGGEAIRGRDYRVKDLEVLWPLGIGSALSAVVVFGLYIQSPETLERYASPELLWIVAICLIYWIARLWIKTSRGEMHDDPVVYAIENRGSLITVLTMVCLMIAAHFVTLPDYL
jgi:4-hydroxybenzoate polyprenyltransferase/phosphoserine phosphatase